MKRRLVRLFEQGESSRDAADRSSLTAHNAEGSAAATTGSDQVVTPSIQELFPAGKIYGLRVLHAPPDPLVDIVLIHGLTGRSDTTFLHHETGIYWPVHLLPHDIAGARILTFGYDADVVKFLGPVGQNTLEAHASDLINDLARIRDESVPVKSLQW